MVYDLKIVECFDVQFCWGNFCVVFVFCFVGYCVGCVLYYNDGLVVVVFGFWFLGLCFLWCDGLDCCDGLYYCFV